jgi:NADH-quinone oxidoreductase subunit N
MTLKYIANLSFYVPELLSILTMAMLLLIDSTYKNSEKHKPFLYIAGVIGLVATLIALICNLGLAPQAIFTNSIVIDPFSTVIKILLTLGTLGAVYLALHSNDIYSDFKSEFMVLSIGVLVGGMLLASANNLLTLYLGVETLSILSYVMASFKKNDEKSSEAGLKYSLYGGLTAGLMLFGMSHIYGTLGTIDFFQIAARMQEVSTAQIAILIPSFLLFLVGIGYKIACVPFHMWSPDVYEGSPIPVTTFFSIVPKMAGMAIIIRVSMVMFSHPGIMQYSWVGTLNVIAVMTMVVGNVSAIGQKSVKRMLAYSSIAHAGMMLLGVVVLDQIGVGAILFYGITYLFMTLAAFYITSFVSDQYDNDHFERFNGLIKRHPFMSICMAIVMFSLAGVPPFSGFVAKFNILSAIVSKGYYTLAVLAVLNSVVSLYYYMKIVRLMILKGPESEENIEGFCFRNQLIIGLYLIPVVLLGIFWAGPMNLANSSNLLLQ